MHIFWLSQALKLVLLQTCTTTETILLFTSYLLPKAKNKQKYGFSKK